MAEVYFRNTGKSPIYKGGRCVMPGQGRMVPVLPGHAPVAAAAIDSQDPLVAWAQDQRPLSVAKLTEQLPALSDDQLQALRQAEETREDIDPRSTLIKAIEAEAVTRQTFAVDVQDADPEQLAQWLTEHQDHPHYRQLIELAQASESSETSTSGESNQG